jgi:NADH-quinone oxidoreductase subunit G
MVSHGGNSTGAAKAGALPGRGPGGTVTESGLDVREMLESPVKAFLLWDIEPQHDLANPALAMQALASAETVVAVSSFAGDDLKDCADVILPLAPVAESEGLFYSFDGQPFVTEPAARALGNARPGWKILHRLGTELELNRFSQLDIESLRDEMLAEIGQPGEAGSEVELAEPFTDGDLYRVGDVAMYAVDALCRRSEYLQQTVHADNAFVGLNPDDAGSKGLAEGHEVNVSQGGDKVRLPVHICAELPAGAVWIKSATSVSNALGDSFGPISVEAA